MDPPAELTAIEHSYVGGQFTETVSPLPKVPRGKAQKGRIVVLVDLPDSRSARAAGDLRNALVAAFYADPSGSFTSTLRRILQDANEALYAENEQAIRTDRTHGSIACAVIRGEDVYVALVGQVLCFGSNKTTSVRLGRGDPRTNDRSIARLGAVPDIGVDLFHRNTSDLTSLVLASPGIVDLAEGEFEKTLAAHTGNLCSLMRDLGPRHRGRRSFNSLAVSLDPVEKPRVPPVAEPVESTRVNSPTPALPASSRQRDNDVVARSGSTSPFAAPPLDDAADDHRYLNGRSNGNFPAVEPFIDRSPTPRVLPLPMHDAIDDAREVALGPARRAAPGPRNLPRLPGGLVRGMLLVLFVAVMFGLGDTIARVGNGLVRNGVEYADAVSKLSQAEQREREGLSATEPLIRRNLLADARQLASASLLIRPGSSAALNSLNRIQKELEAASGATHLAPPETVVELPTAADALVLNGTDLVALDRATSQVYLYMLNVEGTTAHASDNPVLVRQGDHVGPATIGDITSIAWLPAGGPRRTGAWIMLERSGYLIQYVPTVGLSLLALPNLEVWDNVTAIRGYGGNLFVMNPKRGTMNWYQPQPTGFDGVPHAYVAPSDGSNLADAVDLVVQGDVFVSHATGTVDHLTEGKTTPSQALPADLLPTSPSGLAVGPSSIFIGDPRHGRIIQLSLNGSFQRSLTADDPTQLSALRGLAISEDGKFLYALSGTKVLRFAIPDNP